MERPLPLAGREADDEAGVLAGFAAAVEVAAGVFAAAFADEDAPGSTTLTESDDCPF